MPTSSSTCMRIAERRKRLRINFALAGLNNTDMLKERGGVNVLTGEKGSGKSTTLLRLLDLLDSRLDASTHIVAYYDVQSLKLRLKGAPRNRRDDLCRLVFFDLFEKKVVGRQWLSDWRWYVLVNEPAMFGDLRIELLGAGIDLTDATCMSRLPQAYLEEFERLFHRFNDEANSTARLSTLISFLKTKQYDCVIILDNVDLYSTQFQVEVILHLNDLVEGEELKAGFVALRDETYRRVVRHIDAIGRINPVRPTNIPARQFEFFQAFLRRRLAYVQELPKS